MDMQSLSIESKDGIFEGLIKVYVKDNSQLNQLMEKLKHMRGIHSVIREEF
jgi:GTP pyrophosphokinase